MKVCPVCKTSFSGYQLRLFCSERCRVKAKRARMGNAYQLEVLKKAVVGWGIPAESIPQRADEEFLTDLLFALQVTSKK